MNNFISPHRGTDTVGLVRYLFGPGRHNEHTNQRVIAASADLAIPDGQRLDFRADREQITELGQALDGHRRAMGIQVPGGHVWHCSISLPPEDSTPGRKLTDAQWAGIVRSAVDRLGFDGGNRSPCRWLAVHHGTSAKGNEHVHLAVNLVREDGSVASIWNDRRKLSRLCAEFEQQHGLRVVQGRGGAGLPGLSRAELEQAARRPWREPDRVLLARVVRGAATTAGGEADFVALLRGAGVLVRPRYGPGSGREVVGYLVALPTPGAVQPVWFGGGRLSRELTLPSLRRRWQDGSAERRQALAQWRQPTDPQAVPGVPAVPATYGKGAWAEAARVLGQVRVQLLAVPTDDHAAWAGVAREVSGVLSIWSVAVEGAQPGPLAVVADALAKAARTRHDEQPPQPPPDAKNLKKVAKVVSTATRHSRNDQAQINLLKQLLHLIEVIEEANRTRTRALQAITSANTARDRLHAITRQHALGTGSFSSPTGRHSGIGIG